MSVPPGYLSNAELAARVQEQTDSVKQFKDEQTNLYTTDEPTAVVTNAEGIPVEVPSWKKVSEANINADAALAAVGAMQSEVERLGDDVEAIRDGQAAGQKVYRTWTELSGLTGTVGEGAQVIDDAGTHTDPVVGGTVANAGQYVWNESPPGWRWVRPDGLALKADVEYVTTIAGRLLAGTVGGNLIEIDSDQSGNVAFAVHADGTREFIRTKVGGITTTRAGGGTVIETDGKLVWNGIYEEQVMQLGGRYADALMIETDEDGHVGRILWANGDTWSAGDDTGGGGTPTLELLEMISLPDASGTNDNGGFTCTGLCKITTGKWKGCWLVGNDGRIREGSSVFNCSVVMLSPDMRRVVREFPMSDKYAGIQSIQGVAWDTSDNTIWFIDKTNKTIRHIDLEGNDLGDGVVVSHTPNALAYDPARDALLSPAETETVLHVLSCVDGSTIETVDGIKSNTDHIFYDPTTAYLWTTYGGNGSDGRVRVYDDLGATLLYELIAAGSQSIEGLWVEGGVVTIVNDGAFHVSANPPLALANKYRIV